MAPHNLNHHQESEDHHHRHSSSSSNVPSSSQQQQYNYDYNYDSNYHPNPNQYQYQPQTGETIHSIPLNNQKDPVDAEIRFTGDGNEMVTTYLGNHTVENASVPREEPEDVSSYPDQEEAVWNADFGGKATRNTLSTPMHLLEPNGALLAEERGGEDRPEIYQITFLDKRSGKNPTKMPSERDAVSISSDKIAKLAKGIQPSSSPPTNSSKAEEEEKRLQQLNSPPVPPPTLEELMDSKPHGDSYFIPSKGIWLLLSESEDFLTSEHQQQIINYKVATFSSNQNDPTKSNFLPFDSMNSDVPIYEKEQHCVRENEQKTRIVNYQPIISNQDMNHYFGENDRPTELSGKVEEESGAPKTFLWNVEEGKMPNPINSYNPYIVNFNIFTNLNTRSTGSSYGMTDYERILKQKVLYSSGTSTTPTTTSATTTTASADRITSLVPVQLFEKLCARRTAYPLLGELGSTSSKAALRTLIRIVAGAAMGNTMAIPLSSKTIKTKLGIDKYSMVILKLFGFSFGTLEDGRECILPPPIKIKPNDEGDAESSKISSRNKNWRTRLIRGWIEMETWYKWKFNEQASEDQIDNPFQLKIQNALPELERKVGYNKREQQVGLDLAKPDARNIMEAYDILGCAFDASFEVLTTAYKSNKIRNPHRSRLLFGAYDVVYMEHRIRNNSSKLKPLHDSEVASKNFTQIELTEAYYDLGGNGRTNGIGLTNSEILNNFDALVASHSDERDKCRDLIRQLEILSAIRGNPERLEARLKTVRKDYGFSDWGHEGSLTTVSENFVKFYDEKMSKEEALKTFNIDSGVEIDEETLLAIYELISMDSPEMKFKYDKALRVLAEDRQSRFLLNFLETGNKEDTLMNGADDNKPTGINNIGNTCFLNSVLQYFFILIEVRNRVLAAEALWESEGVIKNDQVDSERSEAGKGTGQKEEGRRVGGRVVTEKEVVRSRKFVKYLAQLFNAMISSPFPAVTPERELAYLALVSSRAEEDVNLISASKDQDTEMTNQNDKAGLFSENSNGTDTTLVEEPLQISEPQRQVNSNVPDQKLPSNEPQLSPLPNGIDEDVEMGSPSQDANNEGRFESNKENIPYVSNMDITDQSQVQNPTIPKLQHQLPPKPDFPYEEAVSNTQNSLMQLGAQQDVSECLENVMFQLEVALGARSEESKGGDDEEGEGEDLLPRLFRGRTAQRVQLANSDSVSSSSSSPSKPQAGASVHVKREIFKVLPVEVVEEGNDLYDSLDGFFDEETLIGETGKPVIRNVTLVDPPPVLQIQLQRVQYDRVKGLFKSQAHLDVKEKIYLDRYLDFDLEDKERSEKRTQSRIKRKEINALREKIKELKPSNQSTIPATLNTASNYLLKLQKMELPPLPEVTSSGFDASNENLDHITSTPLQLEPHSSLQLLETSAFSNFVSDYSKVLETEISGYETRISALKAEVEGLWSEEKRVEYQLVSVFMHRGEASHGHYWICQRQFPEAEATQESSWFKYNDSVVTRISRNEVLRDTTGATPYLLCFVRSDLQSNAQTALIETIKREIEAGIPQDATIPTETDSNFPFYPQPIPPPPNSETETGNMTYELD